MPLDVLRELEESLLAPEVRGSQERLSSLIADDFVEFGASGRVFSKSNVLDASAHLPDVFTPLEDFAIQWQCHDAALITYRSTIRGDDGTVHEALRSSLWVLRDDRWQILFHQGTPV